MSERNILISVFDKRNLKMFAKLPGNGWRIISTGGTLEELRRLGIECTKVEDVTQFPEMMGGRLKTLHPKIHGGILADRADASHLGAARSHGIPLFDCVVVNLYDFGKNPSIEMIDIGGSALIRAAAKNHESVTVVVSPDDYDLVLEGFSDLGNTSLQLRRHLARKAFAHSAAYDTAIADWMLIQFGIGTPH